MITPDPIITADLIGDVTPIPTTLLFQQSRKIGSLVPDIVIEEVLDDTIQTTKHPVEVGATISDHAFRMPSTIIMKIAYSDTKHQQTGFVWLVYQQMLKIAGDRELLTVVTGKRVYQNMLITGIHVTTDETTEHILNCTVMLDEIILADTEVTSYSIPTIAPPDMSTAGLLTSIPLGSVTPSPIAGVPAPSIPYDPFIAYLASIMGTPTGLPITGTPFG